VQTIIFLPCGFFLSSSIFFLSSPLSVATDWMSTILQHMMYLSANLECRSEMCCKWLAGNTGRKMMQKSPSEHHRTALSGHIFARKACIDNRKKTCSAPISSTCPDNMVNFDPLIAEIGSGVWGTPGNFFGFRVFAALLHVI